MSFPRRRESTLTDKMDTCLRRYDTQIALILFGLLLFLPTENAGTQPPPNLSKPPEGSQILREKTLSNLREVNQSSPHLGYGFNVNTWDTDKLQNMGFDWIKVFNAPGNRLPVNVLIRVNANVNDLGNLSGFNNSVAQLAQNHGEYIEAYEIGNEPNLDASYGWTTAPVAADYVTLLCAAYDAIKANDPDSVVVSAGLAPTGRVQGNWNGHSGHVGGYQDEREYLKEMLDGNAGNCLDAIGYHNYGYSADFDTPPDVGASDPNKNCSNGFCFRGVEKIYEIMQANGMGNTQVWTTEYGWIVDPPAHCLNDATWQGRQWQIVSEAEQATNLAGSFQYADANWPWMGAMIIFNLNFNNAGHLAECEQMRFYGVEGRPAEAALRDMPKNHVGTEGELVVSSSGFDWMLELGEVPASLTSTLKLENAGNAELTYTITAGNGELTPQFSPANGTLTPGQTTNIPLAINIGNVAAGQHTGSVIVTPSVGEAITYNITIWVVDQLYRDYLPLAMK